MSPKPGHGPTARPASRSRRPCPTGRDPPPGGPTTPPAPRRARRSGSGCSTAADDLADEAWIVDTRSIRPDTRSPARAPVCKTRSDARATVVENTTNSVRRKQHELLDELADLGRHGGLAPGNRPRITTRRGAAPGLLPLERERRRSGRRQADSSQSRSARRRSRDWIGSTKPATRNTDNARCMVFLLTPSPAASDRTEAATVSRMPCPWVGDPARYSRAHHASGPTAHRTLGAAGPTTMASRRPRPVRARPNPRSRARSRVRFGQPIEPVRGTRSRSPTLTHRRPSPVSRKRCASL